MPGHGRDNLLHELEQGGAHVCVPTPAGVTASVLALRERARRERRGTARHQGRSGRNPGNRPMWPRSQDIGLDLRLPAPSQAAEADLVASSPRLGPAALPLAKP